MYLGIDIGTSSLKAVLIDRDQRILGSRSAGLEVSRPHPGWSEQDPDSWWTACLAVLDGLAKDHPREMAAVKGIGLSGQMHGATLLDASDKVLRPCILWNDGRSAEEAAEISAAERAHHRQHRHAGLHRAEADLGQAPRAGDLRQGEDRAPAQGLCPPAADRRQGERHVGFRRHAVARDAGAGVVGRDAGAHRPRPVADAGTVRGQRRHRHAQARPCVALGDDRQGRGCRRRRRQCRLGLRRRRGGARHRLHLDRHLGRRLRHRRPLSRQPRPAPSMPSAMPCPGTWHQMGVALSAAGSLEWLSGVLQAEPGRPRRAARRHAGRAVVGPVPPLPFGRADAAQRRRGARRLLRPRPGRMAGRT